MVARSCVIGGYSWQDGYLDYMEVELLQVGARRIHAGAPVHDLRHSDDLWTIPAATTA